MFDSSYKQFIYIVNRQRQAGAEDPFLSAYDPASFGEYFPKIRINVMCWLEDAGTTILRNVGKYSSNDTASLPRICNVQQHRWDKLKSRILVKEFIASFNTESCCILATQCTCDSHQEKTIIIHTTG